MKIEFVKPRAIHIRNMRLGPTVIGTIERDDGSDPGALARDKDGVYWQVNFGHLRPLDQSEVMSSLPALGSSGPDEGTYKPRNVVLSDRTVETFRLYGEGNITEGMRRAVGLIRLCGGQS